MIELSIDDAALAQVDRALDRIRAVTSDLTEFWRGPAENAFNAYMRRVFDSEGAENGSRWAPLAKETVARRLRPGHGRGGIGVDTNAMRRSLVVRGGVGAISRITPDLWERGTGVNQDGEPYPSTFQFGSRDGKRQPARPIIPEVLPASFTDDLSARYAAWVQNRLGALP